MHTDKDQMSMENISKQFENSCFNNNSSFLNITPSPLLIITKVANTKTFKLTIPWRHLSVNILHRLFTTENKLVREIDVNTEFRRKHGNRNQLKY